MALQELPTTLEGAWREFARRGSPRILMALAALCVVTRLALGGFTRWDAAAAIAVAAFWPVQEWLIHVYLLHFEPIRIFGRRFDPLVAQRHRSHHLDPWQVDLVFIPLQVYLFVPGLVLLVAWLGLPFPGLAASFLCVYFVLALHYEWVHLLVHTRYRPRSRLYARLWRNHRLHHFKNEHYWYGVTMLSGDRLFGTAADRDRVPTSPTARRLDEAHAS